MDKVTKAVQLLSGAYIDSAQAVQNVAKEAINIGTRLEQEYVGTVVAAFSEWSKAM